MLLSGLPAARGFAFQEIPRAVSSHSLPWGSEICFKAIPRELWQLFDVVAALLENGWAGDRSETRIFSSRLCGSFIKNRQINKQITTHYEHVLQFLFKQLFAVLKSLK